MKLQVRYDDNGLITVLSADDNTIAISDRDPRVIRDYIMSRDAELYIVDDNDLDRIDDMCADIAAREAAAKEIAAKEIAANADKTTMCNTAVSIAPAVDINALFAQLVQSNQQTQQMLIAMNARIDATEQRIAGNMPIIQPTPGDTRAALTAREQYNADNAREKSANYALYVYNQLIVKWAKRANKDKTPKHMITAISDKIRDICEANRIDNNVLVNAVYGSVVVTTNDVNRRTIDMIAGLMRAHGIRCGVHAYTFAERYGSRRDPDDLIYCYVSAENIAIWHALDADNTAGDNAALG